MGQRQTPLIVPSVWRGDSLGEAAQGRGTQGRRTAPDLARLTRISRSPWTPIGPPRPFPLTCRPQPPSRTSQHSSARLPVAAASCAGVAPLWARWLPGSWARCTRNLTQARWPARAAWCTRPAPRASVMPGPRAPASSSCSRVARSPSWAATSARCSSILWPRPPGRLYVAHAQAWASCFRRGQSSRLWLPDKQSTGQMGGGSRELGGQALGTGLCSPAHTTPVVPGASAGRGCRERGSGAQARGGCRPAGAALCMHHTSSFAESSKLLLPPVWGELPEGHTRLGRPPGDPSRHVWWGQQTHPRGALSGDLSTRRVGVNCYGHVTHLPPGNLGWTLASAGPRPWGLQDPGQEGP